LNEGESGVHPRVLAKFNERPRIIVLPDGTLLSIYVNREDAQQELRAIPSKDSGNSWEEIEVLLTLPMVEGRWGGWESLVDHQGEIHVFLLNDRGTGVFVDPAGEEDAVRLAAEDRKLDIWHFKTENERTGWVVPKCIWKGYTGALNSVIQMRNGRILLPFSFLTERTWIDRGEGLDAFWYAGRLSSTLVYSDDAGDSWHLSPSELKVHTPSIGLYGGVEPVVLEMKDGRVWMLIRTQLGRLYESFSEDGISWSHPTPSRLISSDSPVGMVRLGDGRIVLLWNKCLRFPYAHGGRHVLHAAVSEDDGVTWIGHREVARDPMRHEPPPPGGDHGTAYPFPAVLPDDDVIFTTGQGEGRISIVRFNPEWLYKKEQDSESFSDLDGWSTFGCQGVGLISDPDDSEKKVLSIEKQPGEWPANAVWNFPLGVSGKLRFQFRAGAGFSGARVMLTNHFSVPFDPEDGINSSFLFDIDQDGQVDTGGQINVGVWSSFEMCWDLRERSCDLSIDGEHCGSTALKHEVDGICYLRLRGIADGNDAGFLVADVAVEVVR